MRMRSRGLIGALVVAPSDLLNDTVERGNERILRTDISQSRRVAVGADLRRGDGTGEVRASVSRWS